MSKYTTLTLQPGERIVYIARLHWRDPLPRRALRWPCPELGDRQPVHHGLPPDCRSSDRLGAGRHGATEPSRLWWRQFTTEIAVTNRRLIYKRSASSADTPTICSFRALRASSSIKAY